MVVFSEGHTRQEMKEALRSIHRIRVFRPNKQCLCMHEAERLKFASAKELYSERQKSKYRSNNSYVFTFTKPTASWKDRNLSIGPTTTMSLHSRSPLLRGKTEIGPTNNAFACTKPTASWKDRNLSIGPTNNAFACTKPAALAIGFGERIVYSEGHTRQEMKATLRSTNRIRVYRPNNNNVFTFTKPTASWKDRNLSIGPTNNVFACTKRSA